MTAIGNPTDSALAAAEQYERAVVAYTMTPFAIAMLEYAGLQPGDRVADVACGTGIVARLAAPVVGEAGVVVAVDSNPAMLAVGQSIAVPAGAAIDWRQGDAARLPLADDAFNVVLCQHGLQFFGDRGAALREMRRALKPGGCVCLAVFDRLEKSPVWSLIWNTIARRLDMPVMTLALAFSLGDGDALRAMLADAGFQDVVLQTRAFMLRQPLEMDLITDTVSGLRSFLAPLHQMSADELATLARAVEYEIGDELRRYQDNGWQISPVSVHFAMGRKPGMS